MKYPAISLVFTNAVSAREHPLNLYLMLIDPKYKKFKKVTSRLCLARPDRLAPERGKLMLPITHIS